MKRSDILLVLLAGMLLAFYATEGKEIALAKGRKPAPVSMVWHEVQEFGIDGLGWDELEKTFTRLPQKAKGKVTDEVWKLSQHSAGVHVRFLTNSKSIKVKWSVRSNNSLNHMAPTAVKGVDLYALNANGWKWVGVGKPAGKKNEAEVVANMAPGEREYLLYFPLYDGVDSVSIGIEAGATIKPVVKEGKKPIVFYGTSITQGACASRAGMAYPAIVGRHLNQETINLGFSGNGKMGPAMAALLAELDPRVYVLDCLPNLTPEEVLPKVLEMVRALKAARPTTPILLVENIDYGHSWIDLRVPHIIKSKNEHLQEAFKQLKAEGVKGLYYRSNKNLIPEDGEGTVDGIHLTDLGFARFAQVLAKEIKAIEKKHK